MYLLMVSIRDTMHLKKVWKNLLERNKRRNGPIFSLFEEVKDDITKFEVYNENFLVK